MATLPRVNTRVTIREAIRKNKIKRKNKYN